MEIIQTPIKDLLILKPTVFEDERGYFFESHNDNFFKKNNLDYSFVQQNRSKSSYGTIRGLHFQTNEYAQAKLVTVVSGRVIDVAVDLRKGSPTFGQHFAIELNEDNKLQLLIPRGFAHGFSVISPTAVFSYLCDNYYNKESESGLIFNDKELNINWQVSPEKAIVSQKDLNLQTLQQYKKSLVEKITKKEFKYLLIGSSGMLGSTFVEYFKKHNVQFLNPTSSELDITKFHQLKQYFKDEKFDIVINCAAYTQVDKAETDKEKCYNINLLGPENLAIICKKASKKLIHFSTDYVYPNTGKNKYAEEDAGQSPNYYGLTKFQGGSKITQNLEDYVILRISWLYSKKYGNNFYKTICRIAKEKDEIKVVNDQFGCPTSCSWVVKTTMEIINKELVGIYNISEDKEQSWFDFAKSIVKENKLDCIVLPISSDQYPSVAVRSSRSVMDLTKIKNAINLSN